MDNYKEFHRILALLKTDPELSSFGVDEFYDCANAAVGTDFKPTQPNTEQWCGRCFKGKLMADPMNLQYRCLHCLDTVSMLQSTITVLTRVPPPG